MKEAIAIRKQIENAENIVITTHRSPDGDAVGSSFAMYHIIKSMGKSAHIVFPDPSAKFLDWIKKDVRVFTHEDDEDEVESFMKNLFNQGYFAGDTEQDAFRIVCDTTNNPPAVVDAGRLICDVYVATNKPAEFCLFRFQQKTV